MCVGRTINISLLHNIHLSSIYHKILCASIKILYLSSDVPQKKKKDYKLDFQGILVFHYRYGWVINMSIYMCFTFVNLTRIV